MNQPTMHEPRRLDPHTSLLPATLPVPGAGLLPCNAAVIHAAEPVLVDTGPAGLRAGFLDALSAVVDPADLAWIWLTHTDPDHVGNLAAVLERAPRARVVTTFLGMGKLGLLGLPTDRVRLVNPGQTLEAGDRTLQAVAPPVYDAPETTAVLDRASGTLFSSDCFGALLGRVVGDARELTADELRAGMLAWSRIDAPWLGQVDRASFGRALDSIRDLRPARVLSAHLPPADGLVEVLLGNLAQAPAAPAFVGPDQAALEALLAGAAA